MKNLLLLTLLLGLIPSTNAGVYYYPNYQKSGIKVKCADGKPNHIVELKEGKIVTLKGHGKRKYKNPKITMESPYGRWVNDENNMCVVRFLKVDEQKEIIDTAIQRCEKNKSFCLGVFNHHLNKL